jgi:hypothetical protein
MRESQIPTNGDASVLRVCEESNGDWYWLFMEDIGNIRPSLSEYRNTALAARWLACLHGATASESAKSKLPYSGPVHLCSSLDPDRKQLPERSLAYYAWTMQVGYEILLSFRSSHGLLVRKQVEDALPLYDIVERCWPVLERLCGEAPRVIAHGDFVEKNLCLRTGGKTF